MCALDSADKQLFCNGGDCGRSHETAGMLVVLSLQDDELAGMLSLQDDELAGMMSAAKRLKQECHKNVQRRSHDWPASAVKPLLHVAMSCCLFASVVLLMLEPVCVTSAHFFFFVVEICVTTHDNRESANTESVRNPAFSLCSPRLPSYKNGHT